uniref:Staygreen protein domain-containing protein n=1 Tax=Physcomitrium patens TaxID=3218 RepID=A0A2K1KWF6_PHYPA|nr:hypothetical protein PHYPA_005075 [Physcomitrium patens]
MATCGLFQPPITAGVASQSLLRVQNASSAPLPCPSSALVSSASHLKIAAAAMCSSASIKKQGCGHKDINSQFWNMESRLGLLARTNVLEVAHRSGSPNPVTARLFGPSIFEAAKLKVLLQGAAKKHPEELPRVYTLTHSDVTSKITLAISREINKAQLKGWYSKLQRDEVVAEWRKVQGKMSLHVHCHISGGNVLHNLIANLRFYIFRKELPVVLEAFRHGDEELLKEYPDLDNSLVWVYFHSNVNEYNRLECWGPLAEAAKVNFTVIRFNVQCPFQSF